jgi:hypothetical protein
MAGNSPDEIRKTYKHWIPSVHVSSRASPPLVVKFTAPTVAVLLLPSRKVLLYPPTRRPTLLPQ